MIRGDTLFPYPVAPSARRKEQYLPPPYEKSHATPLPPYLDIPETASCQRAGDTDNSFAITPPLTKK